MKKYILITILVLCFSMSDAQYALDFGGTNGSFYAGSDAASGIRTIELWFMPAQDYGPELGDYVSLVCREGGPGPNYDEYYIAFEPAGMPYPGHIRFCCYVDPTNFYSAFSEANRWSAGQWYHVAGVFHPDSGMMLFIDGERQSGTAPFFEATSYTNDKIAVAAWGYPPNGGSARYFNGMIDDVRLSSTARYIDDFPVPCPNLKADDQTIALWNLEEGSGYTATDSSSNGNHAIITTGTWDLEYPCLAVGSQHYGEMGSDIYPNPARNILHIDLNRTGLFAISAFDSFGRKLLIKSIFTHQEEEITLDVSGLKGGAYLLRIESGQWHDVHKLLILH